MSSALWRHSGSGRPNHRRRHTMYCVHQSNDDDTDDMLWDNDEDLMSFSFLSARYDEEQEEWTLCTNMINESQPIRRPVAAQNRRRPMSDHALQQIKQNNKAALRYKGENLLSYELDMPLRTTYDYKNPKVSASLQAVLQEAMQTEDDIDITDVSRPSVAHLTCHLSIVSVNRLTWVLF